MAGPDRAATRSIRQYRYQFSIIFGATFLLTYIVFPFVIWLSAPHAPEAPSFLSWLWLSYKVAFWPALGLFSRAVLFAAGLLLLCLLVMKRTRFSTAGFLLAVSLTVLVTAFAAVWTTPGLYRDGSALPTQMQFALTLSVTAMVLSLIIGSLVVRMDISKRPRGLR